MSAQPNRRNGRRIPPRGSLRLICRKGALDLGPNLAVSVLNLSEVGALLLLSQALEPEQVVSLTLATVASGRQIQRQANVVWSEPTSGGHRVAVRLQKVLSYADLDHLARI